MEKSGNHEKKTNDILRGKKKRPGRRRAKPSTRSKRLIWYCWSALTGCSAFQLVPNQFWFNDLVLLEDFKSSTKSKLENYVLVLLILSRVPMVPNLFLTDLFWYYKYYSSTKTELSNLDLVPWFGTSLFDLAPLSCLLSQNSHGQAVTIAPAFVLSAITSAQ